MFRGRCPSHRGIAPLSHGHTQKRVVGGVCASVPLSGYFIVFEITLRLLVAFQVRAVSFFPLPYTYIIASLN